MTKILITGGCGFIGANLIEHLSESGNYDITVLDNESLGTFSSIEDFAVRPIKGDIRDPDAVNDAMRGQDAVVHLAADTRVIESIDDPVLNFETNVNGSFNLLMSARQHDVARFVNASTGGAIIGEVEPPVHERMAPNPSSPYGASKLAVEGYCSAFFDAYGLSTASVRFSNVYGPRSIHKGSVVAAFFRRIRRGECLTIYGDGTQQRDYVYTSDLAEGIRLALESDVVGPYQLGTGIPTTLNELTDMMQSIVGAKVPVIVDHVDFRAGEVRNTYCDISKARAELGYEPSTGLVDGLTATWDWFEAID